MEHNYTIASKAYNLSFIKVITVCLPYGVIVVHVPTSVSTVRERERESGGDTDRELSTLCKED